jgi:diamine N-acetyltransferase
MIAISLHEITAANWRTTLTLSVLPEQQRFIADYTPIAALVLAKAYVRPGGLRWTPYAIAVEQTLVGLVALVYQPESTDDYWLYHFFIDHHYQGQGLGTAALGALLNLVSRQHPTCQQVKLTLHPENERARQLYTRLGFEVTGERIDGEVVYRRSIARRSD